jgi:hypothetical protein
MKKNLFWVTSALAAGILLAITAFTPASSYTEPATATLPIPTPAIRAAAAKGLSLLEKSGYLFTIRSREKCAGCHHNSLTSMAAAIAQKKGVPVTDSFTKYRIEATERSLTNACNPNLIGEFLSINFPTSYFLLSLHADGYKPDFSTDIAVDYLMSQALADGRFITETGRIPLQTGDIHLTAFAIRAIQLYASPSKTEQVKQLVAKTRIWLEASHPDQQQELTFKLLGLQWCDGASEEKKKTAATLLAMQNPDGGWSQTPAFHSDAYATGQTLYALSESATLRPEDPAYQKGIAWLLKTQDSDGAWVVASRSFPIQPYFTSDFPPYDENQFISASASNWAVMALLNALPDTSNP